VAEKLNGANVEIELSGEKAATYLAKKGALIRAALAGNGRLVVGKYGDGQEHSLLGISDVQFGVAKETNNREVIIIGGALGKKGKERRISLSNDTATGSQQLTEGVAITVQTNALPTILGNNIR
jgi:hypothetical protein